MWISDKFFIDRELFYNRELFCIKNNKSKIRVSFERLSRYIFKFKDYKYLICG